MSVTTAWHEIETADGLMRTYLATPDDAGPHPGLLVIQEIFGVNDYIQDVTRRFAAHGFTAAAPELYYRLDTTQAAYNDYETAVALLEQLDDATVTRDVQAATSFVRQRPDVDAEHVGLVGFCYGGRVAYLMATKDRRIGAFASYYGVGIVGDDPAAPIHASENIAAPIILFFGQDDPIIPEHHVDRIRSTLNELDKDFEVTVYPDAGHAFACDQRPTHQPKAAEDAFARTLAFLHLHLDR